MHYVRTSAFRQYYGGQTAIGACPVLGDTASGFEPHRPPLLMPPRV